jgi:hypothetical protein
MFTSLIAGISSPGGSVPSWAYVAASVAIAVFALTAWFSFRRR